VIKDKQVNADIDEIMDCMAGADGGIGFVRLSRLLNKCIDERDESYDAERLLDRVRFFANLIRVANGKKAV